MACRKTNTVLYRVFTLVVIVAVAALSWLAFSFAFAKPARAEDAQPMHDEVFGAGHADATALSAAVSELPTGCYYLTDDIVLTNMIELFQQEDTKICLHGHSITISGNHIFKVYTNSTLSIYDCGGADNCGTIRGGKGVYVMGGTLNLYGGAIKEGYGGYGIGCGVTVSGNGTFNMYDGAITDNKASGSVGGGGGVYIGYSGTFNMYGGTISNNSATNQYGAGVYVGEATAAFHMYGGTITNNTINFSDSADDGTVDSYGGAGVCVNGGTFSVEGNVNISGNTKGKTATKKVNNVQLLRNSNYAGIIEISGKLDNNARIGVTMPVGVLTNGYSRKGNTLDPSVIFGCDDGLDIGYDDTRKEAAVKNGADVGGYNMESATVTGAAAATVGDTSVTLTVEVALKNSVTSATKTITDAVTVNLSAPLHGGNNTVSTEYTYNGESGTQTEQLSYVVVPSKKHVYVTWSISGATQNGQNAYKRDYDGNDILGDITATYTGYDGLQNSVAGSSADIIVKDNGGNTVTSVADEGVYSIYLAPSVDYEFDNNMLTLTVEAVTVDDGYYKLKTATATGVFGAPVVGDKKFTVTVVRTLEHTGDKPDKTETVRTEVTLANALHVGDNTVAFDYTYTDARGDVQTKSLSLTVTAVKKQVTVRWYFDGTLVSGNAVNRLYDGADGSAKIVAEYDGYDGEQKRIVATAAAMLKTDSDNNAVSSLTATGIYKLSLAESADYVFKNNLFTFTVAESIGDISDLVYEEEEEVILGVSSEDGFESGTQVVVEKVEDLDDSLVYGKISSALNVSFVNNSVEVTPTGVVTVRVIIPDELKDNQNYKIYNLNNGVATQVRYTTDGDYAVFESDELNTILFVVEEDVPIIDPIRPINPDNNEIVITIDDSGLVWLWVFLGILAACAVAVTVAFIVKAKRNKK